MRAEWYDLGVQLEIQTHDLDVLRLENQNDTKKCLRQMLSVWLLQEFPSPPSWERVVDALSSPAIDRPTVAERIRRTYCSQSSDAATDTESFLSHKEIVSEMEKLEAEFEKLNDDVFELVKTQPADTFKVRLTSFSVRDKEYFMEFMTKIIHKKRMVSLIFGLH